MNVDEFRNGIPLQGLESVKNALAAYGRGVSKSSRDTESHNLRAYTEMHPLAGMLFLQANNLEGGDSFVDRMMEEAEPELKRRGRWSRHYDYDGQGSFHKTSVEITALPDGEDLWLLGLNAAYVGKEPEAGLAEYLGVEQGLHRKSAEIQIAPEGDQLRLDFDQVLERLREGGVDTSLIHRYMAGEQIVDHFMMKSGSFDSVEPLVLAREREVELTLEVGRVGERFTHEHGERSESRWAGEGSVLSAPLDIDYRDETKPVTPSILFTARRVSAQKYNRLPLIDPQSKQAAEDMIAAVAAAFRS